MANNKELKYGGYTAQPSDYECQDGDLAVSLNLICEDGEVHPVSQPKVMHDNIPPGYVLVYIHKIPNSTEERYIFRHDVTDADGNTSATEYIAFPKSESFWGLPGAQRVLTLGIEVTVYSILQTGNTLVFLTSEGTYYSLLSVDNSTGAPKYISLGNTIPELALRFSLEGVQSTYGPGKTEFGFPSDKNGGKGNPMASIPGVDFSNAVMGALNKAVAECHERGAFALPFMVRYALRFFDGSYTRQSAPMLLTPVFGVYPYATANLDGQSVVEASYANIEVYLRSSRMRLEITDAENVLLELDKWKDIVTGVDIFISEPIYTYDQSGNVNRLIYSNLDLGYSFGSSATAPKAIGLRPVPHSLRYYAELPMFTEAEIEKKVSSIANFYLVKSIPLDELAQQNDNFIEIGEGVLPSLLTRQTLPDDYDSHDRLSASVAFNYNSRINLANITKYIAADYSPFSGVVDADVFGEVDGSFSALSYGNKTAYCYFVVGSRQFIVKYIASPNSDIKAFQLPFYYHPSPYLRKIVFTFSPYGESEPKYCIQIEMKRHEHLNGSYFYNGIGALNALGIGTGFGFDFKANDGYIVIPKDSECVERVPYDLPNKIYTSEVNNPFYFPLLGINTVGTGTILGISTAAKALSQGQFGQFPLYAFSNEGVWALEVSATGTYSAKQPITRDSILENTTPLQMDNAVLFATDRGIMLISGSQTQCITDVINGEYPFDISELPGMEKLHSLIGHSSDTCISTVPFLKYLSECGMLYDYVHQRVIVYNSKYTYAYVYSLKSKLWGMIYSTIEAGINSYPEALAVDHKGGLLNFSTMQGESTKGLLVTRPLKLEMANIHKTIDTVIQRGNFAKGHVQSVLYGSRDLINWHLVWSSKNHCLRGFRGTPYKYFRIALVCDLQGGESIYGATVQFTPRLTNQPR